MLIMGNLQKMGTILNFTMPQKKPIDIKIGNNIRRIRETKGMSQQSLADAMNVQKSKVSGWESGSVVVGKDILVKLANELGCKPFEFLLDNTDPIIKDPAEIMALDDFRKIRDAGKLAEYKSHMNFLKSQTPPPPEPEKKKSLTLVPKKPKKKEVI